MRTPALALGADLRQTRTFHRPPVCAGRLLFSLMQSSRRRRATWPLQTHFRTLQDSRPTFCCLLRRLSIVSAGVAQPFKRQISPIAERLVVAARSLGRRAAFDPVRMDGSRGVTSPEAVTSQNHQPKPSTPNSRLVNRLQL